MILKVHNCVFQKIKNLVLTFGHGFQNFERNQIVDHKITNSLAFP